MHESPSGRGVATPWWQGARGEWYVGAQLLLFAVVAFGPRHPSFLPAWPPWAATAGSFLGIGLLSGGSLLLVGALAGLGRNLTPLPYPKDESRLVRGGAYRLVRHPMYASAVMLALGWAFVVHGTLTVLYAAALFAFFDIKARREERWLLQKFPEYSEYRRRVRKLIPFVY